MNHLINQEKNNPELQNTLDIQTILESAENVDNNYIGDHSLKTISKEVYDTIKEQNIETDIVYKYCTSLLAAR